MAEPRQTNTVLHILAGDLWGGKEAQMKFQLPEIEKRGWKVWTMLFNEGVVQRTYSEAGLRVEMLAESQGFKQLLADACASAASLKPSVIVAHGYKEAAVGLHCARKLNLPFIYVLHGAPEPHPGMKGVKLKLLFALTLLWARFSAARIICVSRALARSLGIASSAKTKIVYNVVSPRAQAYEPQPVQLARPAIVAVGRFVHVKRFDVALRAHALVLAQLAESAQKPTLYFVGDGPEELQLKAMAAGLHLGEQVRFLGFRKDAVELISAADLFLLSSDSEGIPTVLLEALSAGTPIVATAVGGIPEVMKLFPGYPAELVRPGDPKRLAYAVQKMLRAERARPEQFEETLTKNFSAEVAARQHAEIYREVSNNE